MLRKFCVLLIRFFGSLCRGLRRYQGCERTCQLRRLLKLLHKAFKVQGRRLRFCRFLRRTDIAKIRLGIEGSLEFLSIDLSILVQPRPECEHRDWLSRTSLSARPSSLGDCDRLRKAYLEMHRPILFNELVLSDKLFEHCAEIDEAARNRMELIVRSLAEQNGVTEQLKAENQMEWVRQMNACKAQAEEVVKAELIYD